jgi:hypothetical protein
MHVFIYRAIPLRQYGNIISSAPRTVYHLLIGLLLLLAYSLIIQGPAGLIYLVLGHLDVGTMPALPRYRDLSLLVHGRAQHTPILEMYCAP